MIVVEQRGPVALLLFSRPEARNAIDDATAQALVDALAAAERDDNIACVVLASGHPDVFLSGGDLRELKQLLTTPDGAAQISARGEQLAAVERSPLPVVAAVQGAAFGGGCELLLMCDVIVMERRASLRFVHGKMGLTPAWGGTTRLIERVGAGAAAELLLTAAPISAERAERLGLAQRLAADGQGLSDALALAEQMAALGKPALAALKHSLLGVKQARRGDALAKERSSFEQAYGEGRVHAAVEAFFRR